MSEYRNFNPKLAFDLEGTLVDLEKFHHEAWRVVAEKLGVKFGPEEIRDFIGLGLDETSKEITRLGKLAGIQLDPEIIKTAKDKVYHDMLNSHTIEPREGVPEYLEKSLTLMGGEIVLATVTTTQDVERILGEARLKPFFKYILTKEDVKNKKPHPEIYHRAAGIVGVPNKDLLVHEDSPAGAKSAKTAGSPVAVFPVHENLSFDPKPDAIYMGWHDLDPRAVIDKIFGSANQEVKSDDNNEPGTK